MKDIKIYKQLQPNIILNDIQMTRMDGHEFIENLNKENHNSKIIVFSAYGHSENVMKFLRMGVCDFIQKPVNFAQLTTTLLGVVNGKDCKEEEFDDA